MVFASASTAEFPSFSQNAAEPHPNPAIQRLQRRCKAMSEISVPAANRVVGAADDVFNAVAPRATRLDADRVLELVHAAPPRPAASGVESAVPSNGGKFVSQKLEPPARFVQVDDPGLVWVPRHSVRR